MQALRVIVLGVCAVIGSVVIGAALYGLLFKLAWPFADPIIAAIVLLSVRAYRKWRKLHRPA